MKIIIIYPEVCDFFGKTWENYTGTYHYGIGCLSASLKAGGHNVSFIHITHIPDRMKLLELVKAELAVAGERVLIAFSSVSHMFPYVKQWAEWIKQSMDVPIICGGAHCMVAPEEAIAIPEIDAIAIGEADLSLPEFCDRFEQGVGHEKVPGFWVKHDGKIIRNPCAPVIESLDRLPFPDRELFKYETLSTVVSDGVAEFKASRGCPYDCTYCSNHAQKKIYGNPANYVRFKSVEYFLCEIEEVLSRHPMIKQLFFDDDIFTLKRKWIEEFINKYPARIGLPYGCQIRPNLVKEDIVRMLAESGCKLIHIGLESGASLVRNEVLNRNISDEMQIEAFRLLKKYNLTVLTYNMVGIPYETMDDVLSTIKFNAYNGVDEFTCSIYSPFKGTKLWEICKEKDLVTDGNAGKGFYDLSSLRLNELSEAQLKLISSQFRRLVRLYRKIDQMKGGKKVALSTLLDYLLKNKIFMFLAWNLVALFKYVFKH